MKPSRKLVDISFWLSHAGIALGILLLALSDDDQVGGGVILSIVAAAIAFLVYTVSVGLYVQKFDRLGILWSAIVFFLSPLAMWGTYIALFFMRDEPPA